MGELLWEGIGVVDVDVEDLVDVCERYCLVVVIEVIFIMKVGKWLWVVKGLLIKLFVKGVLLVV